MEKFLEISANWLLESKKIGILTGAGISKESGIPTFRGEDGLWKNYSATELATPQAFQKNPTLVWEWYLWRRKLVKEKKPNAAHYALVDLKNLKSQTELITQNVDGLHRRSGFGKHTEMHGYLFRDVCTNCTFIQEDIESNEKIPHCPQCQAMMRPGVVWFGEMIPQKALTHLQQMAEVDLLLVIGTSKTVYPAAGLVHYMQLNNKKVIEINPELSSQMIKNTLSLGFPAGEILPKIIEKLKSLIKT